MWARYSIQLGALAAALLLPVACQDFQPSKASGFKGKYMVARAALEEGSYARASRNYKALLAKAGPLETRVRLEYAHALLRDGKFAEAAREAGVIVQTQGGDARLAALAVQGTADHELARSAMTAGQRDAAVKARLQSARAALKEVLKKDAKTFDPLGGLAGRLRVLEAELSTL